MIVSHLTWSRNLFQTSYYANVFRCLTAVSSIMHSPLFCNLPVTNTSKRIVNCYLEKRISNISVYSIALSSALLSSTEPNNTSYSMIERIRLITNYIDDANERDLYNIFADIIYEIFGRGSDKGWELDKLKTTVCNLFFLNFHKPILLAYINSIDIYLKKKKFCPKCRNLIYYYLVNVAYYLVSFYLNNIFSKEKLCGLFITFFISFFGSI